MYLFVYVYVYICWFGHSKKKGGGGGGIEHRKEETYASMGHSHIFAN